MESYGKGGQSFGLGLVSESLVWAHAVLTFSAPVLCSEARAYDQDLNEWEKGGPRERGES